MECETQERLYQALILGEALAEEDARHVAACPACAAVWRSSMGLDAVLNADQALEPRPGFDTAFFARLEQLKADQDPATASWSWHRWFVPLLASVALAAGVVLVWQQVGEGPTDARVAFAPGPASPGLPDAPDLPDLPDAMDLQLLVDLEVLQDYDMAAQLDKLETYELLAQIDLAELEGMAGERQ